MMTYAGFEISQPYSQILALNITAATGEPYRLPSEAEWEYAARGGTTTARYWGDDRSNRAACSYENVADRSYEKKIISEKTFDCNDEQKYTAPVGSYMSNKFGLYDILGNVGEWVEDCYAAGYKSAIADGNPPVEKNDCELRAFRGGAWDMDTFYVRSSYRAGGAPDQAWTISGFRVARMLTP